MTTKEFEARKKVLQDLQGQLDETKRMKKKSNLEWKIRGYSVKAEYWAVAYSFPISIILGICTQSVWVAVAFWTSCHLYSLLANFRGMSLYVENLVEWYIRKTI